jgi:hypothetical protein
MSILLTNCFVINTPIYILFFLILLAAQVACHAGLPEMSEAGKAETAKENKDYLLLGLVGYNYNDRYISSYTVDSAGGGHINLSSSHQWRKWGGLLCTTVKNI